MKDMKTDEEIDAIIQRINAEYGEGSLIRGDEEPPVGRISTNSLELDYVTGGGIPIGRWSRFYGAESSGKSLTCWNVIANAQKMGMTCAYYNAEKQYTKAFAEERGVDTNKLLINQGTQIEDIGERMESLVADIDLHVIDSCSSTITRVELADGLNEREYMAIRARKWAQQFAFVQERFDQTRNTIILVDQVRSTIGSGPMASPKPPGGRYMEHVSSMTLEFKRGKWLWYGKDGILGETQNSSQKTLSGGGEADGVVIQVRCMKSRVSRPFRSALLHLDLNVREFDHIEEMVKAAKHFGVVKSSGGWIKVGDEEKSIRPVEFRERLEEDENLRDQIRTAVLTDDD